MIPESRQSIHFGVNFLMVPSIIIEPGRNLEFQKALLDRQIPFRHSEQGRQCLRLVSLKPEPLEVQVSVPGPQISQLLIVSPQPNGGLETFSEQAELICAAFKEVWTAPQQIISRDACIRHLYQSKGEHAFQFLWEKRLRQSGEDLKEFGQPVLGGGLRFVIPPPQAAAPQIQVKIESFLRDSSKLFVETRFLWQYPVIPEEGLKPGDLLEEVEHFATENVVAFVQRRATD